MQVAPYQHVSAHVIHFRLALPCYLLCYAAAPFEFDFEEAQLTEQNVRDLVYQVRPLAHLLRALPCSCWPCFAPRPCSPQEMMFYHTPGKETMQT